MSEKYVLIPSRLRVLYFGGNCLTEIPAEVGQLNRLQALVLSDNYIESLPSTIAQLKKLKSLLLHNNRLTTLPPQIIALRELMEVAQIFKLVYQHIISELIQYYSWSLELIGSLVIWVVNYFRTNSRLGWFLYSISKWISQILSKIPQVCCGFWKMMKGFIIDPQGFYHSFNTFLIFRNSLEMRHTKL